MVDNINDNKNPLSLIDLKSMMADKVIPVKEMVDYKGQPLDKILTFWRRHGLLPFIEAGKWIELSWTQLFWIRILDDLRSINFPVEKMKVICKYFFLDAYEDNLPLINLKYNRDLIQKKIKAGTNTLEDDALLYFLNSAINEPRYQLCLQIDINYLSNFISRVLADKVDGSILIFFDGSIAEFIGTKYVGRNKVDNTLSKPYIHLSISNYLREFIDDDNISEITMTQLLNDDEMKVLREMRNKNVKEIIITNKDNNKFIIESSRSGIITDKEAREIRELLSLKNYEKITINTIDEKSLSFKVTRKRI